MKEKANSLLKQALDELEQSESSQDMQNLKVKYVGKSGAFSQLMKELGKIAKEDRPNAGKEVNLARDSFETQFNNKLNGIELKELNSKLKSETIDLTLPGPLDKPGTRHPISLVTEEIVNILSKVGFSVRTGPMIETQWYNFEALNIPKNHPARDMQDTFYIDEDHVLRTHTSPIQIRTMENEKPPLRVLAPGSVFRCDSDVTHSPNFYQIEGLLIDEKVSMSDLKGIISFFVKEFFGPQIKTRFRPSFFPFTEPSAEVDCSCPICKGKGCRVCSQTGWIEIGGSGLVNPKVIELAGLKSDEWQGFAFGFGVERMAMIKYGIDDIRLINENHVKFLDQFSI